MVVGESVVAMAVVVLALLDSAVLAAAAAVVVVASFDLDLDSVAVVDRIAAVAVDYSRPFAVAAAVAGLSFAAAVAVVVLDYWRVLVVVAGWVASVAAVEYDL